MNKRVFIFLVLAVIAIGSAVVYRMLSEAVPRADAQDADVSVAAAELYQAFQSDETAAGQRFNDKVVAVSGTVREISNEADGRTTVVLESGDPLAGIVCEFPPGTEHGCTVGGVATIKGFCAGFNLDVLLQRCAPSR